MNVLSDFAMQLQKADDPTEKIDVQALELELIEKDRQLKITKLQLDKLRTTIAKAMKDDEEMESPVKKKKKSEKGIIS